MTIARFRVRHEQAPQGRPALGVPKRRRVTGSGPGPAGQRCRQAAPRAARQTIEPVFGQLKTVQGAERFMRRGLGACEAEWTLPCGTHNLRTLWRHTRRQDPTVPHSEVSTDTWVTVGLEAARVALAGSRRW